jgi:hydrophobic/amphiphilic exporter-1 (mainly G- bacteria), HAE1 family
MQWLAGISVKRPVFATVLILGIVVLGAVGYQQLGVDRFPKVDFPMVMVRTQQPGASPREIETEVSEKIEEAVNTIAGIEELRSYSAEGSSTVAIQFRLDKDIDVAAQEVRDRVNTVLADLPVGVEPPVIQKMDPDATPILYLAVNADKSVREVTEVADKVIRPRLENVAGVGQIQLLGGRERQIHVWLDPVRLRAAGITAAEVQRTLATQNVTMPGGSLETGPSQLTLRIKGRVEDPLAIGELVVRQAGGHPIRVRDVARVEDGEAQAETASVKDGKAAVVLAVRKQSGTNTVAAVDAMRERIAEIGPSLPSGFTLEIVRDNSATIRTSVHAVEEHLILGALFAALVVLVFLGNLRSTLIAAIAIPVSIIGTFSLMWIQGFTLDTITLLALALAVGIVIDDAIVVLENIYRFIHEKGMPPMRAAILATKEIGLAVLATTLSLIAVFVPVAFMDGIVGRFLKSFGLTMAFSIFVSLVVSFTLTPMLAARWLRPVATSGVHKKPLLERLVDWFYLPVERVYMKVLGWSMRHRWVIVVASFATLLTTVPLMGKVQKGFLPISDEAHFEIVVRAPEGTSLEATTLMTERVAREVRSFPGVRYTLVTVGDNNQRAVNRSAVYVKLVDPDKRSESQIVIMERVRREVLPKLPKNLRMTVAEPPMFAGGMPQSTIVYELSGPDLDTLTKYADQTVTMLKAIPGAVDVDSDLVTGKPEVVVAIDREKAADLGVSVADVATALRTLVGGIEVGTYEEQGEQYALRLRADGEYRADSTGLALLTVPSTKLGQVPLLDVVRLEDAAGPSQINHLNRRRQVTITANVAPGYAEGGVLSALVSGVEGMKMPAEYDAAPAGRSKEMGKAAQTFVLAFGLSILFMYLVLAAQFESWLHPVTILVSLPLTLPFAILSLILLGQSLNIYSTLGILVLFGVIKKNAILQIDHANHLRAQGMARTEAILLGNKDRLRPILMTTLAFVAGMLPLVFSKGIGAGFNTATAGVIVGGQVLSLLLTLLATPVMYSLFDDLSGWVSRRIFKKEPGAVRAEAEAAFAEAEAAEREELRPAA